MLYSATAWGGQGESHIRTRGAKRVLHAASAISAMLDRPPRTTKTHITAGGRIGRANSAVGKRHTEIATLALQPKQREAQHVCTGSAPARKTASGSWQLGASMCLRRRWIAKEKVRRRQKHPALCQARASLVERKEMAIFRRQAVRDGEECALRDADVMSPRALVVVCYGLALRRPLRMAALMTETASSSTGCCLLSCQTAGGADDVGGTDRPFCPIAQARPYPFRAVPVDSVLLSSTPSPCGQR